MPLDIPAVIQRRVELDVERVDSFRQSCEEKYERDMQDLRRLAGDEDERVEDYADEAWLLEELRTLASQMAVVGLYKVAELGTNRILRWRWRSAVVKKQDLYKADRLKAWLMKELSLDVASLPGYSLVDELRQANNAVKHEAKVSAALAKFPGWTEGEPLGNLDALFARAKPAVPQLLGALAQAVVPAGAVAGPDAMDRIGGGARRP